MTTGTAAGPDISESVKLAARHIRPHRVQVVVALVLLVLAAGVSLVQPLATQIVLQALADRSSLATPIMILVVSVLAAMACQGGGQFLILRAAEDIVLSTRSRLVQRLLGLSVAGMQRQQPGDLMSRVVSDTASIRQIALQSLVQTVSGSVLVVGSIGMMIYLNLGLFLITFGVIVALCAFLVVIMPRIREASRETQHNVGQVGNELERAFGAFTTIKAAGSEQDENDRVAAKVTAARNSGVRGALWTSVAGMTSGLTVQAAFLVVLGIGGLRVQAGGMNAPELVAFLLYAMQLSQPLLQLTAAASAFQAGRAALERIAEAEGFEQEVTGPAVEVVPAPLRWDPAAELRGVDFTYPGQDRPALRDVSLVVPRLGTTALIGPSGSGKSTVLRLIEGFFPVDHGDVLIAGRSVAGWNLTELRSQVAYVEQETPVLAGTIEENVTYGLGEVPEAAVRGALVDAGLQSKADRLDAEVGHRGQVLSGGERQRISIARALLRRPRLLMLDEATSQLDAANEANMRALVREISEQIPVLLVAHRLSTVVDAEQIILMEQGGIRAVGTHLELMARDELYRSMVAEQSRGDVTED